MAKIRDLKDHKYGKLSVISYAGSDKSGAARWLCKCDCENEVIVRGTNLTQGLVTSCGCARKGSAVKHGDSNSRLYRIWYDMIRRTEDPRRKEYEHCGARGIKVCEEWHENYLSFKEWSINNGYSEQFILDRKNKEKDYTPDNCRWLPRSGVIHNQDNTCYITAFDITKSVSEWARDVGMPYSKLKKRIRLGWPAEKVLSLNPSKKSS